VYTPSPQTVRIAPPPPPNPHRVSSEPTPAQRPFRPPPRRQIGAKIAAALAFLAVSSGLVALLRPRPVIVTPVARGTAVDAVYATGTAEAFDRVTVKAKVAGTVTELLLREGAAVKKGDLIARIAAPSLEADLARGKAELHAAKRHAGPGAPRLQALQAQARSLRADLHVAREERDRLRRLVSSGSAPQADLDRASSRADAVEAQVAALMADYRAMQIDLEARADGSSAEVDSLAAHVSDLEVRAPIDGVVLSRHVDIGQVVSINEALFRVGDITNLVLECAVDEADVGQLTVGKKALATFYAFGSQTFEGEVTEILPDADRAKKTFLVRVRLKQPPAGLRSGMSAELNMIIGERPDVLLVPLAAVDSRSMAWVIEGSHVTNRSLKVGVRDVGRAEIVDGLHDGDRVVVEGLETLREGMRVSQTVRALLDAPAPPPPPKY